MYALYTANGSKLTTSSKGFAILRHIANNGGASKYDCLTIALGKSGSKNDLRGYYSSYFRGLVDNGVLNPSVKGVYTLTEHGKSVLLKACLGSDAKL